MPQEEGLSWSAPTHEPLERSADWYWGLGVVALAGIVMSVYWDDVLLAIIIAIAAACFAALAMRHPRECEVRMTNEGIVIDHELHPYRSLRTFWVHRHPSGPRLLLTTEGILHPHISIPLREPASESSVRAYLSTRIHEEEHHSPSAWLIEFLGL